jgi:hypothetical protein
MLQALSSMSLGLASGAPTPRSAAAELGRQVIKNSALTAKINTCPKIFCTAYITPDAPGQGGQEATVAKYPIAIVAQDNHRQFRAWRDRVKSLNPAIVLLAYIVVIEETTVPGPGHDVMRTVTDAWATYPGGYTPTVGPSHKKRRIFDPRPAHWGEKFIAACRATLDAYEYDGLFLDQCTIFPLSHPLPAIREEMAASLQRTLIRLRQALPEHLIVANCKNDWIGINGAMNENRISDFPKEARPYAGQYEPRLDMLQSRIADPGQVDTVMSHMQLAHSHGAFYSAAVDYQHVLWFDFYDRL